MFQILVNVTMVHNNQKFFVGTWNARSVVNNKFEVEALLNRNSIDVLSITETWLNDKCPVWEVFGYNTFRKDRNNNIFLSQRKNWKPLF